MEAGIDIVADGLFMLLNQVRGDIDAALRRAGSEIGLKTIQDYYDENIDKDMYPILMMQEARENLQWFGLPNIAENVYQFTIWGLVAHDDPRTCIRLRRAFASALKIAVNRRHLGVSLPGVDLEFSSPYPPIYSIDYNVSQQSNVLVRGFAASFAAECHPSIPDTDGLVPNG